MKKFMDEEFLLSTETARTLYHQYAEKMPIIDYHCHISPQEIAEDMQFESITDAWLGLDHYKWRQIRSNGYPERVVTGDADKYEKFQAWAATLPKLIGNPLYHWTHLELKRYFGITEPLSEKNCREIYDACNKRLQEKDMSVRGIIKRSNVKVICTTDDPVDDLRWHKQLAADPTFETKVLPAFRPDKAFNIDKPGFVEYIAALGKVCGCEITSIAALRSALGQRLDYFGENGCRVSDHALDYGVYAPASDEALDAILRGALSGKAPTLCEAEQFKTAVMLFLGEEYAKRGWIMQIHFGAIRNNNSRLFATLGADCGCDSTYTSRGIEALSRFLDALNSKDALPKTVLYSLNGADNALIGSLIGCFQGEVPGKLQLGSAWWFNDTKVGMVQQMTDLANLGILANFIGMLTDSRSFLSYTRHEYFRRILCDLIGSWVENGEYPADIEFLGQMVQDISYNNTLRYFGFDR